MSDVRHLSFHPQFSNIGDRCVERQAEGFALVRVVQVTSHESIAVFERASVIGSSTEEVDRG